MNFSKRILLIEDDPDQLACLATLLELNGYAVTSASSGAEGLNVLQTAPIDIVVSDVAMPQMDGPSFVSQLRKLPQCAKIPVILLSAGTEPIDFSKVAFRANGFRLKKDLPQGLLSDLRSFE